MKVTAVLLSALVAIAQAQSGSAPATVTAAAAPTSTSCNDKCAFTDIACRASCAGVPNPNPTMIAEMNSCNAQCPTAAATDAQQHSSQVQCLQNCVDMFYLPTGTAAATPHSGAATATAAASGSGNSGSTGFVANPSSSSSTTSASKGAANNLAISSSVAGIAGIMALIFAL